MTTIAITLPADQLEGTSATLSQWLVEVGQSVATGDPILELETDKVSMEICATADGMLAECLAKPGDKVEPEVVLGHIDTAGGATTAVIAEQSETPASAAPETSTEELKGQELLSPCVRRLINEHDLDINQINGTGRDGRVTRKDIEAHLEGSTSNAQTAPVSQAAPKTKPVSAAVPAPAGETEIVPHSNMRRSIASHMVDSLLHTSPHVTSVFEMNMHNIIEHRKWHKKEYAELGINLTYTAYFLKAMAMAVEKVPATNARFHEDHLEIFKDVNVGAGTALGEQGLVVPVVKQVQNLSLQQIAEALTAQTEKARSGSLTPKDMTGGTITISNHGVSGSLIATPIIINQPQVAILGVGKLEKRVVVETRNGEDELVVKPMCYVTLTIDHRALDAHQTNAFLSEFVSIIEHWGE